MKRIFAYVAALVCACVEAATWTGGGDGSSWGDPANWGGMLPTATEDVAIATGTGEKTINLGGTDREMGALTVTGAGKLTLSGAGALVAQRISSSVNLDVDAPVTLKTGGNVVHVAAANRTIEFRKPVAALGQKHIQFTSENSNGPMYVNFRDVFTAPQATMLMQFGSTGSTESTSVHFYGKVTLAKLSCCSSGYRSGWCYLHASGNEIAATEVCYGGIVLAAENALPATTPLQWSGYYREGNHPHIYSYSFAGVDQVAEAIRCAQDYGDATDNIRYVRSTGAPMTLTLKGASDAVARCFVYPGVSLVWDPLGDFTQEFVDKASTTEGMVTVKHGAVKVSGSATFAKLTRLTVEDGAAFDLASTESGALADLIALNLGADATMRIAAESVNPFANQTATARIAKGGRIATEAAATLLQVIYDGQKVPGGTYGAGATPAEWVSGSGTVTVIAGSEVSQEVRTWTGAGDGTTWSDDANWDTRAPYSKDTARFNGSATVTSDILLDAGPRTIEVASGATVVLSGSIGGTADIVKTGAGFLTLSGSNTFTGSLSIDAGRLTAVGDCALGDNAEGAVAVSKKGDRQQYNLVLSGVTVRKQLIIRNLDDAGNGYAQSLQCAPNTVNTVLGKFSVPNSYLRMSVEANAKFIIAGGGTFGTSSFFNRKQDAEVVVTNSPIVHSIYHDVYGSGRMVFACAGNRIVTYDTVHSRGMHERIETWVNGALDEGTYFWMGLPGGAALSLLDLCGTTQRVSRIEAATVTDKDWTPAPSGTIRSDEPAKITFVAPSVYTNSCVFSGPVAFEQAGSGTVYLTAASSSSGELVATAGEVVLREGASWAGDVVVDGGTVRVPGPAAISSKAAVALKAGTLDLGAGEYFVAAMKGADGLPLPAGRYGSTASGDVQALPGLAGEGVLTILPSGGTPAVYTWTGAGDGRFSSAANWEGDVLPDFSNILGEYRFPGNGFTATVDVGVNARSFVFSSQLVDTVRLVAEGDGAVTFTDGLLVVTGAVGAAKSVVLDVPVKYVTELRVRAGDPESKATANHVLTFTNRISTLGQALFTKDGYGTLNIAGDANDIQGDLVVSNGFVNLSGADPLGGSGSFRMYVPKDCVNTKLFLRGTTVSRPLWFTHPSDGNGEMLCSTAGTTNYVDGLVTCAANHFRNRCESKSELHYRGGLRMAAFFIPYGPDDRTGFIFLEGEPASSGSWYWSDNANAQVGCVVACPGNRFDSSWNVYNELDLRVDNALASNQKIQFNYWSGSTTAPYGMLNIHGTRQEFATATRASITVDESGLVQWVSQAKVSGTAGSQLKLSGSEDVPNLPVVVDAADYVNAGTATRWFRDPCTSTGKLSVVSGTLVLAAPGEAYNGVDQANSPVLRGGAWAGPEIMVSGGVLKANHAKAIDRKAEVLFLDTAGKLEIPAGVSIPCSYVYVDGVRQPLGTYTAANFGDHVSGGGALVSRGLGLNTVLVIR